MKGKKKKRKNAVERETIICNMLYNALTSLDMLERHILPAVHLN